MKKVLSLLIISFISLIAVPAEAQIHFGIRGGVNISSVHFSSDVVDADNVTGFHVGPMVEAMVSVLGVGIDAAVLYSQKGMEKGSESMNTDYIDIPVNLKWKFGLPLIKGYLAAGPYVGFRVGGDKIWVMPEDVTKIKAKSFGAGLNFGAGVELISHVQVGFNYGFGLTDNYSSQNGDGKNRGWSITAAILF